jgi:hypothetical protein
MFSLGSCHAVFQNQMVLLDGFDTICNEVKKAITTFALFTFALSLQNN